MKRRDVLQKVIEQKRELGLTIDQLSKLAQLGNRTVVRFLGGEDVKLSTLEKITEVMGLDFAGRELIDAQTLRQNRAEAKARQIVALVQDTSALEMQGLSEDALETLIVQTREQFLTGDYRKNLWAS